MPYLNKQNAKFILALNSYLTAALLIPKHIQFNLSDFLVKINICETNLTHIYIYIYICV